MSGAKVLLTGATGFVGRHLASALLERGFQVRAVARNVDVVRRMPWFADVEWVAADLHGEGLDIAALTDGISALAHLAWPGLPNYGGLFHFERNLPADYAFIRQVVEAGVKHVMVTGTCFEYGLQSGALDEDLVAQPANPYGLAKNTLRLFLESLARQHPFTLQWARLFYLHGEGQNPNSLLASLERAIDENAVSFDMSAGEQLRDYLPITTAARHLAALLQHPEFSGVVNISSGQPVSVRRLVEQRLKDSGASLSLNLGAFGYSAHEPMAFWGNCERLQQILGAHYVA
ncbi:NAD-dependent epimerase/dehydratase family protein [Pseudomonas sp. NPDC088368]|uniref:NAD-dependent epimerase/dehydratase family protein n=1 Tax=Pseudomonas sp. NPDC088368 TaxID=3364453 RepID=UPI00382529B8